MLLYCTFKTISRNTKLYVSMHLPVTEKLSFYWATAFFKRWSIIYFKKQSKNCRYKNHMTLWQLSCFVNFSDGVTGSLVIYEDQEAFKNYIRTQCTQGTRDIHQSGCVPPPPPGASPWDTPKIPFCRIVLLMWPNGDQGIQGIRIYTERSIACQYKVSFNFLSYY